MSFSDSLNEILQRADIVDIARHLGITIGKRETSYTTAICPFHDDRTPSLALYRDVGRPHYFCFACGAQGGLLDLVEKKRRGTRAEGLRWLAEEVGVQLPETTRRGQNSVEDLGAVQFRGWLKENHREDLLLAFAEQRRIDAAALIHAPAFAVDLSDLNPAHMQPGDRAALERAGVIAFSQGKWRTIARGKQIVFPVDGESEGFIFRAVDAEGGPKGSRYRFSKGCRKSERLFGYNKAKLKLESGTAPDGVFVVEGVMDALRLSSLGFAAVALLGTSISASQAKLLHALCLPRDEVVRPAHLFLDSDDAGRRALPAALRALLVGLSDPMPIDIVRPDQEGDPDELLGEANAEEARSLLEQWAHSVLAALAHHYTGLSIGSVLDELPAARPLLRVDTLRYIVSQFAGRWSRLRDLADPGGVYLSGNSRPEPTWLRLALDRAAGIEPHDLRPVPDDSGVEGILDAPGIYLRRALRIAQSSNFRREYPFDWGGMTRLALAANTTALVAAQLLGAPGRVALPYPARLVPKEDGRTRLKAGPWPEDALLQQYVLSELLRARPETPGWYLDFPAVRLVRNSHSGPHVTGPSHLVPVGPPDEPSPVVSFAYQIDQQIVDGDTPPRREGMFVPYRECWQQFVDHLDDFVARQPLETDTFFAVRLDISGFFDNLPRFATEGVLADALRRGATKHFSGRSFGGEVAPLLAPGETQDGDAGNLIRAEFLARWLADQSFGYRYFDPADGSLREARNPTVGIPQGPDLSAFLANLALYPLDRAVTAEIEADRVRRADGSGSVAAATYGRYVDDMVVITTSETLLTRIEAVIAEELRKRSLSMNAKHERTKALSRRRIREWLLGERGAAVLVSAGGGDTPTTNRAGVMELLEIGPETQRSHVLQLLHSDELYDPIWASDDGGVRKVEATLRRLRTPGSVKLRYYDWVSAARWKLHSLLSRSPNATTEQFAQQLFAGWGEIYQRDTATQAFGEDPRECAGRQDHLTLTPLLMLMDAIERTIDSRHDRRTQLNAEIREALRSSRSKLAQMVVSGDLLGHLVALAQQDLAIAPVFYRVAGMLQIQRLGIAGLAAGVVEPCKTSSAIQFAPRGSYVERRFALNGLANRIRDYNRPVMAEIQDASELRWSPEAEPLLGLHEALARLLADGMPGGLDPLEPLAGMAESCARALVPFKDGPHAGDFVPAVFVAGLINLFLEKPIDVLREIDTRVVLHAFVEVVAGVMEGHALLANRKHLVESLSGPAGKPVAVPPSVDAKAFFADSPAGLEAFAFQDGEPPQGQSVLFGLGSQPAQGSDMLARFKCSYPESHTLAKPQPAKLRPEEVKPADLREFARAYRELAVAYTGAVADGLSDTPQESDRRPLTPLHLLRPIDGISPWQFFGAVSKLPVGQQAFVRLGEGRLHSVAVYANGAHLWQVGFALADNLGYRGFARSSELDRLSVAALEPNDTAESIPFYIMQLTVPRLCGAFMGRSRVRIEATAVLPLAIDRQLARLESFPDTEVGSISHLAHLLEAGAEARAAELLRDTPAPLQVAGALSAVFRAVGRAASRPEKIFSQNLPTGIRANRTHRRTVDLWLASASRLRALPVAAEFGGLKSTAAAMQVVAIGRLAQALTLEIWALLRDTDRERLGHFTPFASELELPDEVLLISGTHTLKAPSAADQVVRLIGALISHAAPGTTARSALDQITPLGWVVALATVAGLLELQRLPSGDAADVDRPELLAARLDAKATEARPVQAERKLWQALIDVSEYLARSADPDAVDAVQDPFWPWSAFAPLVDGAEQAVANMVEAASILSDLYGLMARTCESRFFAVTEPDERGMCLVQREDGGRSGLSGWQIDRDSLALTRLGDLETRKDEEGGRKFVWSETLHKGRLIAISIAYRSLAEAAGFGEDSPTEPSGRRESVPDNVATPSAPSVSDDDRSSMAALPESVVKPIHVGLGLSNQEPPQPAPAIARRDGATTPAVASDDPLRALNALWHAKRAAKPDRNAHGVQPIAVRIALLQMNVSEIGHSFYHPFCEVTDRDGTKWEKLLAEARLGGKRRPILPSPYEAWRRAILREALERCNTLGVELLVLPEYAMRPETITWLAQELEDRSPATSVLAGTFRHAARAEALDYATGMHRDVSLGALVPLIIPSGAQARGESRERPGSQILSRLKKYPSVGLAELIRPESYPLKAVWEMWGGESRVPDRLRYVRELVCSEVFMAMSPANIYSTLPILVDLHRRFGTPTNTDSLLAQILDDIKQIAQDTSPAVFRGLMKPRQTIIAVPAATTRPFDHHIFGEAGAKAAGLVTVFTNMSGGGRGQSCFIGHYKSDDLEGASIWGLQSPYHGRAPGIWTYNFTGGKPLGKEETALVVADVNPIDTNASKPTRQVENLPITLVAHIPFFLETRGNGGKFRTEAERVAKTILAFLDANGGDNAALAISCRATGLGIAHKAREIAETLAEIDKTSRESLSYRAEGLRFSSMQPHHHPSIPAIIDWAFVEKPSAGISIDSPEIEAWDLEVEGMPGQ